MPITALPTPPSRQDPANFAARGDALLSALPVFVTEANALQAAVNEKEASTVTKAGEAAASAAAALISKNAAATSDANSLAHKNAAAASEANSLAHKNSSADNASAAAGSAASALAIYGTAAAMQTKLDTAAAQANAAAASAASAGSVLQQDLSMVSGAPLHRSPNAIVAQCIYDTSLGSDGGAWVDRMSHTSWMNEPLNGAWLGQLASEAAARALPGVATGDYYQLTTNGKFYKLNAGSGTTEVFRGNKAKFPRLAAIVAEADSVTLYDLTEAGRPMWMRFTSGGTSLTDLFLLGTATGSVASLYMLNGKLGVGKSTSALVVDFLGDTRISLTTADQSIFNGNIATRNSGKGQSVVSGKPGIVNSTVNAVAMTVLPDAPIDPATGLQVPTIAVATAGGVSVIKADGTVVNITGFVNAPAFIYFTRDNKIVSSSDYNDTVWVYPIPTSNTTVSSFQEGFAYTQKGVAAGLVKTTNALAVADVYYTSKGIAKWKRNPANPSKALAAAITDKYNTGHMVGDTRRCYLANTEVESVSNPATVVDRSYKAAAANIFGTLTKSAVATAAQLVAYRGFSTTNYLQEPYSADLDFGTGEWSVSAWVNTVGNAPMNAILNSDCSSAVIGVIGSGGAFPTGWVLGSNYAGLTREIVGKGTLEDGTKYFDYRVYGTNSSGSLAYIDIYPISNTAGAASGQTWTASAKVALIAGALPTADIGRIVFGEYTSAGAYITESRSAAPITSSLGRSTVTRTLTNSTTAYARMFILLQVGSGVTCDFTLRIAEPQLEIANAATIYKATTGTAYYGVAPVVDRSAATGPNLQLALSAYGKLTATAYDGTTARTVTTANAYNTGTWLKARATYVAGKLAITVNGVEVASTVGTPLLTMSNSNAVLTIGNTRTLDAPFPGSIALLKIGATVPTPEQAAWMYEQEKQMFRDGAQITLPSSAAVTDMAYDQSRDRWVAVQAGYESSFTGLVRTAANTPSAGSFAKVSATSGVKLLARTTTSPGVDVTIPAYGLREEVVKRGETAAKAVKTTTSFDFDTVSFTATTTNASNQLTAVASVVGTPYIGMGISGTGIPAGTTIIGINGTTYTLSANATAAGTAVAMGQTDFTLPVGYTAKDVLSAGVRKREGTTKDWVRLFDGFRETVRFAVSPGSAAWVQINAAKE